MSLISKVVNWDVFSALPIEPVQYYSILKKKREFSLLIQQYDSQASKQGYLHYCCIVPKKNSFNLNYKYDIFILFLNEISFTSFIGLRLKVNKDTFVPETNSLLLFLKNSNKTIHYFMSNNCIHVKCSVSDAWELFYCLYEEYLKRHALTVIGTRFFYSFTYLHFIEMEKQLLAMLYKGSKTVKISKKSVFYKIHRKRKVSVSELIYITHNMPKNKKHVMSCFRFKASPVALKRNKCHHIFNKSNSLPDSQQKMKQFEVTFHDLRNTKLSKESICYSSFIPLSSSVYSSKSHTHEFKEPHPVPQKRKFQEIDTNDSKIISSSSSKFFKRSKSDSNDHEGSWEKYSEFKPYSIKSYTDTPCLKNIVPRLLKDGKKHNASDFTSCKNHNISEEDMLLSAPSVNKRNTKESTLTVKKFTEIIKSKKDCFENLTSPSTSKNISPETALVKPCNNETSQKNNAHELEFSVAKSLIFESKISSTNSLTDKFLDNTSNVIPLNNALKSFDENFFDGLNEVSFSTATGKSISISNAAILSAQKLMKDVLNEKIQASENKVHKHSSFKDIGNDLKKLNPTVKYNDVSEELLFKKKNLDYCNISQQFKTDSCTIENLNEEYFNDYEDVSFTTAGGKNISVSNSALLVAQKIMKNVLTEETKQDSSLPLCKKRKYPDSRASEDNDCSPKRMLALEINDIDMNRTLVEKFFEDSSFEEKVIEPTECITIKNQCSESELNRNTNLPNFKPRKSLGGRRSMRYSDKL